MVGAESKAQSFSSPAVYSDWSVLSKLLLGFVHLSNEIYEAFSSFWHSLLWPVGELELADCSGLAILRGEQIWSFREKFHLKERPDSSLLYSGVCASQISLCFELKRGEK